MLDVFGHACQCAFSILKELETVSIILGIISHREGMPHKRWFCLRVDVEKPWFEQVELSDYVVHSGDACTEPQSAVRTRLGPFFSYGPRIRDLEVWHVADSIRLRRTLHHRVCDSLLYLVSGL